MAKKYLLFLVLAAGVATGAFAQSLWSIGGGLVFDTGSLASGESWVGGQTASTSLRQTGFGAGVFVDATFVELSLALMRASRTLECSLRGELWSRSGTLLDATLLGKLPIFLGWGDIFPLLGLGGKLGISEYVENGLSLRIVFGVGSDVDLTRNMFVRASLLGSYRFPTGEWDWLDGGWGVTIRAGFGLRL